MNNGFDNNYGSLSEFPMYNQTDYGLIGPEQQLINRKKNIKKARKIFSGICFCLFAFLIVENIIALVFYQLLGYLLDGETIARYNVVISTVLVHLIIFPIGALMIRPFPKNKIVKKKKTPGYLTAGFLVCLFVMTAGALCGKYVNSFLSALFGTDPGNIVESGISGASIPELIIFVAVIPGIVEELVFRKMLIDRTAKFSGVGSVIFSGLLFGLIHGNFEQFFYAFFVGIVFGVVYLESGNIWYTIAMHTLMNIMGSVIPMSIGDSEIGLVIYALVRLAISGIGMAFFIVYLVKFTSSTLKPEFEKDSVDECETIQDCSIGTGDCIKAMLLNPGTIIFTVISIGTFLLYFIDLDSIIS